MQLNCSSNRNDMLKCIRKYNSKKNHTHTHTQSSADRKTAPHILLNKLPSSYLIILFVYYHFNIMN